MNALMNVLKQLANSMSFLGIESDRKLKKFQ